VLIFGLVSALIIAGIVTFLVTNSSGGSKARPAPSASSAGPGFRTVHSVPAAFLAAVRAVLPRAVVVSAATSTLSGSATFDFRRVELRAGAVRVDIEVAHERVPPARHLAGHIATSAYLHGFTSYVDVSGRGHPSQAQVDRLAADPRLLSA
jgi:hypothetical protein